MERIQNKLIRLVLHPKVSIIFYLCYMVFYFSYLYRRETPISVTGDDILSTLYTLTVCQAIPFMFLNIITEYLPDSRLTLFINKISKLDWIIIIGYPLLLISAIMPVIGNPSGIWWTWSSFGLALCIILFVIVILKNRLKPFSVLCLGVAASSLWQGLWEIPYQMGFKLFYDAPQITEEALKNMVIYEIYIELPLIIGGLIILFINNYKHKIINLSKYTIIFLTIYMAGTIWWYLSGFWVDVYYDWTNYVWVHNEYWDKATSFIYKVTKVALALSIISLFLPQKRRLNESIY